MDVYLQPGYCGREITALYEVASRCLDVKLIRATGPVTDLHVGSVEFIESIIGTRQPDFYPEWTRGAWHRRIEKWTAFVKSAEGYKVAEARVGEFYISDPVTFVDEWRHYCANGISLMSWWYQGSEETCDKDPHGPPLPFDLPAGFSGAVDIGRLDDGRIALVEVQHPYAIGWYGETSQSQSYFDFLLNGWKYLVS